MSKNKRKKSSLAWRWFIWLRRNRAYVLLKILEELVESNLYRAFEKHVGGSCNLPLHFSMGIIIKIGTVGIIGQIYRGDGLNRTRIAGWLGDRHYMGRCNTIDCLYDDL